ncbi:MAG: hypothetical protein WBA76_20725 [Phormidesmis sp.]
MSSQHSTVCAAPVPIDSGADCHRSHRFIVGRLGQPNYNTNSIIDC